MNSQYSTVELGIALEKSPSIIRSIVHSPFHHIFHPAGEALCVDYSGLSSSAQLISSLLAKWISSSSTSGGQGHVVGMRGIGHQPLSSLSMN